jgi:hypothetical protein
MDEYWKEAIAIDDFKESLLYYDYIIPLGAFTPILKDNAKVENESKSLSLDDFRPLLPPRLACKPEFRSLLNQLDAIHLILVLKFLGKDLKIENEIAESAKPLFNRVPAFQELYKTSRDGLWTQFGIQLYTLFNSFDLSQCHVDGKSEEFLRPFLPQKPKKEDAISLSGMNLIDVTNVPIKQVLEFRNDKEAREKLRRFRLFAYKEYKGKNKAFIEDDILQKLDEYNLVVKKWGFETAEKSLTFLTDSKALIGTVAAALIGAYFGEESRAMAGTLSGASFAIGNLALTFGKQYFAYRDIMKDNPVSYIADAKKKLEKPSDNRPTVIL